MCHTLNNHPVHIFGSFSQRTAFKFGMVAECESGLNALGLFCCSNGLLCCILKRTSSACALCVAWFVHWLRVMMKKMMMMLLCVAVNIVLIFILYQRFIHDKHREPVNFWGSISLCLIIFNEHL